MLRAGVRVQLAMRTLRERAGRVRDERGAEAVQVALITAALVGVCVLLILALQGRAQPAIDEING